MLLGRDRERQAVDRLLADARLGRSGVLAIAGEPGIGKTALLEHAAGHAGRMRVLRARGIESEAEVPFASLLELLRPALGALDSIPEPQAEALAAALALRQGGAQDRFAIGAATLSLLAAYAEEAPLLLLVDDAHWLDGSSAEALLFAFRRLVADPIAVLIGVRDQEPSLIDGSDLPLILLEGLDRATAAELTGSSAPDAGGSPLRGERRQPAGTARAGGGLRAPRRRATRRAPADLHQHRRGLPAPLRIAARGDPPHAGGRGRRGRRTAVDARAGGLVARPVR